MKLLHYIFVFLLVGFAGLHAARKKPLANPKKILAAKKLTPAQQRALKAKQVAAKKKADEAKKKLAQKKKATSKGTSAYQLSPNAMKLPQNIPAMLQEYARLYQKWHDAGVASAKAQIDTLTKKFTEEDRKQILSVRKKLKSGLAGNPAWVVASYERQKIQQDIDNNKIDESIMKKLELRLQELHNAVAGDI